MKKGLFIIIASIFLFTSCIDYTSKITVNEDGSGTVEETVLLNNMIVDMLSSFSQGFSDSSQQNEGFKIFDEAELKEQAADMGEGVRYMKGEKISKGGMQGYNARFEFDDISMLKVDANPGDKIPGDNEMTADVADEDNTVNFSFIKGDPSRLEIRIPKDTSQEKEETEEASDTVETDSQWGEQTKMFLRGLKFSMVLETKGDIVETNATYVKNNQITIFELNFDELLDSPEKYEQFKKLDPQTIDEMREIVEGMPGFKIELKDNVFVEFN